MKTADKRVIKLVRRGTAHVDEILEAGFGEWPPRGLDIIHANPQTVVVTDDVDIYAPEVTREERKKIEAGAGMATSAGPRRMLVLAHTLSVPGEFMRTAVHEVTHILQGDHQNSRSHEIIGIDGLNRALKRRNHPSNIFANSVWRAHGKSGWLRNQFNAHLRMDYYAKGLEIQARMAEALATGYPVWKKLPQTKDELHFALVSSGLYPPASVERTINKHPHARSLRRDFPQINEKTISFTHGLSLVQGALKKSGQEMFWQQTLPAIYCDLIEMYGDRYGRERFGYGMNETHALRTQYEQDVALLKSLNWSRHHYKEYGDCLLFAYHLLSPSQQSGLFSALNNVAFGYMHPPASARDEEKWIVVKGEAYAPFVAALGLEQSRTDTISAASPDPGRDQQRRAGQPKPRPAL